MIISSSTTCVGSVLDDEEWWTHTSSVSSCGLNILSSYLIMIMKLSNIKLRAHFSLMSDPGLDLCHSERHCCEMCRRQQLQMKLDSS